MRGPLIREMMASAALMTPEKMECAVATVLIVDDHAGFRSWS
jgi:hypothetical protein